MLRLTRLCIMGFVAAIVILGEQSSAMARPPTVRIQLFRAGVVVGVSRGSGVLTYNGHRYPLSIGGVSLGAIPGVSRAELIGNVYNLHDLSDIEGTYTAAKAGLSIAGGRKVARLTNSRRVVLEVRGRWALREHSAFRGLIFSVDLSGTQISLRR